MRVLVDKLWPRGLKKTDAKLDLWMKEVAPTPNFASGSATSRNASPSSSAATRKNCPKEA